MTSNYRTGHDGTGEGDPVIALISAPSNLGLRPPQPGSVPGTSKAPEALRETGLHEVLIGRGAVDWGAVLPGRYVDDEGRRAVGTVRNQGAIIYHARLLARRIVEARAASAISAPMPSNAIERGRPTAPPCGSDDRAADRADHAVDQLTRGVALGRGLRKRAHGTVRADRVRGSRASPRHGEPILAAQE